MNQGNERLTVQPKKYHFATYTPKNNNANKAYAEYQNKFGRATTAQPTE